MAHQTAVLLCISIPEDVAAAEPKIPNPFIKLNGPAIVVDQQYFPIAELWATVLSRIVEEHDAIARLPVQLFVLAAAVSDARMPHFIATPPANEITDGMVLVRLRNRQFARARRDRGRQIEAPRGERIRVISARRATRSERARYEKQDL